MSLSVEQKQEQEGGNYCYHCKRPLKSLIAINKITMKLIVDQWEAEQGSLKFHCPHCNEEINVFSLKTKKMLF